jgi:cytochrome c551/c552
MKRQRLTLILLAGSLSILGLAAAVVRVPALFITSDRCQACHNGLVTARGEDVSIGTDWRASIMAHTARDPYWQASIRRETLFQPKHAALIQDECSACHMPMARFQAKAAGGAGQVFANLPVILRTGPAAAAAIDGVSCAVCHQIAKDKLGDPASFSAGFVIDTSTPWGSRRIFGPFDIDKGRQRVMRSSTGFEPEKAEHITSSELCATCHTLFTDAFDNNGEKAGGIAEQTPYLEWKHSAYYGRQGCQSCHMPEVEGETAISATVGKAHAEVGRHVFLGGNFFMLKLLNRNRDTLGVAAESLELETAASRTAALLERSAAELAIGGMRLEGGLLKAEVEVMNMTGHKLPSAYPSRRAWIRLSVLDANGEAIFVSGRLNSDGSIAGNDNDADRTKYEPHYAEIKSEDEVQVYESILGAPGDRVTTVLLAATGYLKDNRIVPAGFDKTTADEAVAVKGGALEDGDFRDGRDRVRYIVPVGAASGPFTVRAELWYQPISFRWAHNVDDAPSEEAGRFISYYREAAGSSAIVLARAEATAR